MISYITALNPAALNHLVKKDDPFWAKNISINADESIPLDNARLHN